MKTRINITVKVLLFSAIVVVIFCGLFAFLDVVLDRQVADWFQDTFFTDMGNAYWSNGGRVDVHILKWNKLKDFLLVAGMVLAAVWAVSIMAVVIVSRIQTERKTAKNIGRLLRQYFTQEENTKIFPPKYEDVADYAATLKDQINHNKEMLVAESARKNDLIAYLAHDLKTPLTSVIGYISLLKEAPDMPVEQRAKYTHIALEKALRLESLINEFFDITRYNLHEIMLEEETFDLAYMLMQMADEFYPVLEQHGKSITIHAEEDLPIAADSAKLARVFNNILKNAVAYSYDNTEIEIHAEKQDSTIQVSISNFGKTIPKQKLDMIFEKFYRLDDARSTNTGGAGLGLAIAKDIIVAHGGTISVTSEKQITTFLVELPIHNT